MSATQVNINAQTTVKACLRDELYDEKSVRDKQIILERQREGAKYRSISDTLKFISGLLLTVGLAAVTPVIAEAAKAGTGILIALTGATAGLSMVGIAAAVMGTAMVTDYIASRKGAAVDIDKYRMGAYQTAREIRKQLEERIDTHPLHGGERVIPKPHIRVMPEYDNPPPANGQTWLQISGRDQPVEQTQGQGHGRP